MGHFNCLMNVAAAFQVAFLTLARESGPGYVTAYPYVS
ncbi:hypothetical protein KL86PLE_90537 [uncultured Pleomorphomonas sp.]|uniref:Uncharacterized protein n=1 Tax=uncultured Pleomorphomonas sp. TaxID=442121 RepID=A0A212LPY7_9HYPH|nr:hypothetical protein KL86PLE_90537 [uncultured Pleomorphomonas sp.]